MGEMHYNDIPVVVMCKIKSGREALLRAWLRPALPSRKDHRLADYGTTLFATLRLCVRQSPGSKAESLKH